MRIAITSLYLPSGSKIGVGYQVHYFANQMVARGHSVTVFSQSGPSPDSKYDVEVIAPKGAWRTFRFAWDLRYVNFREFDILHAHGDDWFLWGKRRPRHIHTYHGSCLAEFLHEKRPKLKARMLALAGCETASTALCDEPVAVSANTCRFLPRVKRVIPNGLDLDVFTPGAKKSEVPAILFVGTLWGRKRGDFLIREFQREVLPKAPDAKLWMVCDDKVDGPGVMWFGRVCLPLLAELYRRAWVFCLPSSYEGFGIPYIEAMASGTAVVASPNLGAKEVTACGRYGLLSEDDGLGKALLHVIENGALRHTLEDRGIKRACEFSWESVCGQYERLYRGSDSRDVADVNLQERSVQ
ncbi:MAG: glycosyltransferase family 4 protein [Verrucomicrobiota bacterium]